MYVTDFKLEVGKSRRKKNKGDCEVKTVCVGIEQLFKICQQAAHNRTEYERADNFDKRIYDN